MDRDVVSREPLRHDPLNEVTASVERVVLADGRSLVRKELRAPSSSPPADPPGSWAASDDPGHWNSWSREADVHRDAALRRSLHGTGLDLPASEVEDVGVPVTGAVLWMEDVVGVPGERFGLADHAALATGLGRWQAQGPLEAPWASRGYLREYSGSRRVAWEVLDDDAAWSQPLVRDTWPGSLRSGWTRLVPARERLLQVVEQLPRTRSHLWPAERFEELETPCVESSLAGLADGGWRGGADRVRLGVLASCVKYAWLLPLLLERARAAEHSAYHRPADAEHLYAQRGLALSHLVRWCDEALALAESR